MTSKVTALLLQLLTDTLCSNEVGEESEVGNPYQWDSLQHVKVMLAIEKAFQVRIPPNKFATLTSVRKICEHLSALNLQ